MMAALEDAILSLAPHRLAHLPRLSETERKALLHVLVSGGSQVECPKASQKYLKFSDQAIWLSLSVG
jgi:hypothetical protein